MPQSPTGIAQPIVLKGADGSNDQEGISNRKPSSAWFSLNTLADSDSWGRRAGRDYVAAESGIALGIYQLSWDDGTSTEIAMIGSTFYNMSVTFTYMMDIGIRVVIQSPDLSYWDATPAASGLINPVVIAAPAAAAQLSNFTIANGQSFGFRLSATEVTRLLCDRDHNGWYLQGYGATDATSTLATDMVFTVASGFSLRQVDYDGNTWKYQVDNNGKFYVTTV